MKPVFMIVVAVCLWSVGASAQMKPEPWRTNLDRTMATGSAAIRSGDIAGLTEARHAAGRLFVEIALQPEGSPAWVAPCEHAASAAATALKSAVAGNMRGTVDSFETQAGRYRAASQACKAAIANIR